MIGDVLERFFRFLAKRLNPKFERSSIMMIRLFWVIAIFAFGVFVVAQQQAEPLHWSHFVDALWVGFFILHGLVAIFFINPAKTRRQMPWIIILAGLLVFTEVLKLSIPGSTLATRVLQPDLYRLTVLLALCYFSTLRAGAVRIIHRLSQGVESLLIRPVSKANSTTHKNATRSWILALGIMILIHIGLSAPLLNRFIHNDEFHHYSVAAGMLLNYSEVGWNFLENAPGYHYDSHTVPTVISLFFRVFGEGIVAAKAPSLLLSIANIVLLFAVMRKVSTTRLGLVAAAIYATNPFFVWQSAFIRDYVYVTFVFLAILLLCFRLLTPSVTIVKSALIFLSILILVLIGYDMREYFAMVSIPVLLILLVKAREWIPSRTLQRHYGMITVASLAITGTIGLIILRNTLAEHESYQQFFSESFLSFSWYFFDVTFLNFNQTLAKIFIGVGLFVMVYVFWDQIRRSDPTPMQPRVRNLVVVLIMFVSLHLIFGFLIEDARFTLQYGVHLIILNILVLVFLGGAILKSFRLSSRSLLGITVASVLFFNGTMWFSSTINDNFNSGYNLYDMYQLKSTGEGRAPENYDTMYDVLEDFLQTHDGSVILNTEYIFDPQQRRLEAFKDRIQLMCPRAYYYKFYVADCRLKHYDLDLAYEPISIETLEKQMERNKIVFFAWPARKSYKFQRQEAFAKMYEFEKLSGSGIDESNIDIFVWLKH